MYVPFIITWGDGRSISDFSCPEDFASNVICKIQYINSLLRKKLPKKSRMHTGLFFHASIKTLLMNVSTGSLKFAEIQIAISIMQGM